MIKDRLKQLRLALGLSLAALAEKMGGIVTKQALSKYELGKAQPTPKVLARLSEALEVKVAFLWEEPQFSIEFISYRKKSSLHKKEQSRVENLIKHRLERCLHLQMLLYKDTQCDVPIYAFSVKDIGNAEQAAEKMRDQWALGRAPIASMAGILEDHCVHVIELPVSQAIDGFSAVAFKEENRVAGAAVVTQINIPGERMRLNLAHELGHLVLKPAQSVDPEKAAFRFGTAFLAPAEELFREIGQKRTSLNLEELLLLKKRFGMSIQAILYRLRDLKIISDSLAKQWWMYISHVGWKKHEPQELLPEKSQWIQQNVLRAVSEGLMVVKEGEKLLGRPIDNKPPFFLNQRRAFLKFPIEKRRRILTEQAEKILKHYQEDIERKEFQGGDFFDNGGFTQPETERNLER